MLRLIIYTIILRNYNCYHFVNNNCYHFVTWKRSMYLLMYFLIFALAK